MSRESARVEDEATLMDQPAEELSTFRWVVCALLFSATVINYMDRQVLGILVIPLQKELGWTESQYGLMIAGFQLTFAFGLVAAGPVIDRLGSRLGYALAVTICSIAAVLHGFVRTVTGFGSVRLLLGLGEAGNFPSAVKATAEWFPVRERAFAMGLFNSGSTVGAILAPLLVPPIALFWGWRAAFILIGVLGFIWIPVWLSLYRRPLPRLSAAAAPTAAVPIAALLKHRQTWVFLIGRAITEPVWWFYLYWAPKFLASTRGMTLSNVGIPLMVMYAIANAGGLFGGWLSSTLLKRGWSVPAARKTAVLTCALLVVPVAIDARMNHAWAAVLILGLAMAGHQGWASNLYAMLADMYPTQAVASITGLILKHTGSYEPILVWASMSYLVVLCGIHLFIPKLPRVDLR